MAVLTNFLKLLKPEKNDYVDVDKHISENYDKIDGKMQELNTSNSGKLDKGALPTTIKSGKDLYDMLENNGGINIDTALLYLNDAGTKTAGKVYFDKNKKGLFECIKTTTNTVNSTEFFVDISNKASSDRLTNLFKKYDILSNITMTTQCDFTKYDIVIAQAVIYGEIIDTQIWFPSSGPVSFKTLKDKLIEIGYSLYPDKITINKYVGNASLILQGIKF